MSTTDQPNNNQPPALEHPGTWLPGDKAERDWQDGSPCRLIRGEDSWRCGHGGVTDSTVDRWHRQGDLRITHLVPRVPEPADQPPVLPDTSGWVKRAPGDVIEAGTRVAIHWEERDEWAIQTLSGRRVIGEGFATHWTPPPVPREPWRDLSTDWDKPTLAKVTWKEPIEFAVTGLLFVEHGYVRLVIDSTDTHGRFGTKKIGDIETIESVELLDTYDPATHLPVERALIDEAARLVEWWNTDSFDSPPRSGDRTAAEILTALAALAAGAESNGGES